MTPKEIAKYYISPLDPTLFPDSRGITKEEIKKHTTRLEEAIEKLVLDFSNKKIEEIQVKHEKQLKKATEIIKESKELFDMLKEEKVRFYSNDRRLLKRIDNFVKNSESVKSK